MTEIPELKLPPGIPESIPFERMQELVAALGLPLDDLRSFSLYPHTIEAEFYARHPDTGTHYIRGSDNQAAMHRVSIKVDRGGPDDYFVRKPETEKS